MESELQDLSSAKNGEISNEEHSASASASNTAEQKNVSESTSKSVSTAPVTSLWARGGVFESLTKGLADSSRGAVKAVQVKARQIVSQNKRRYQEGGFDLDLTYITDNIIAMGFPAGDMSSGLFVYVEGFYRNPMEEVIKFFDTRHKGKYKIYNLCSERMYDASLFHGKAASCPFEDQNCPPIHLISSFCKSASEWLKADLDNVVVIHCKAGVGRTGLMTSSFLLFMKICPTAEEAINLFNQKRCVDGKGLIRPSQIRYVKYFERILKDYSSDVPPGRRCMLRGFRLHKCPYWIRPSITISNHNGVLFSTKKHPKTKDLMAEDFWVSSSKKGIAVFAIPGEPGLTELAGDFKIHFHDRNGDFYCWFNTTLMENRTLVNSDDFDDFHKRKLPSPTFQVEIVMIDYDGTPMKKPNANTIKSGTSVGTPNPTSSSGNNDVPRKEGSSKKEDRDDVFSDSDGEEDKSLPTNVSECATVRQATNNQASNSTQNSQQTTEPNSDKSRHPEAPKVATPDFKAIAADASVFSFGNDEDYESE